MEYLYLAAAALGAFALGWRAAQLAYSIRRELADEPEPIDQDEFTRSVMDWGRRYER